MFFLNVVACLSAVAQLAAATPTPETAEGFIPVTSVYITIQPTGDLVDDKHETFHDLTSLRTLTASSSGDRGVLLAAINPEVPLAFELDGLGRIYSKIDDEVLFLELGNMHLGEAKHATTGFTISKDQSTVGAILPQGDQNSTSNWMIVFPRKGGDPFPRLPAELHYINCYPAGPLTILPMGIPAGSEP